MTSFCPAKFESETRVPPSRGRSNAGALAPSTRPPRGGVGVVSALGREAFAAGCREASALNGFCVPLCEDSARDLVDRSLGFSPAAGGAGGLAFRDGFLRFACVA